MFFLSCLFISSILILFPSRVQAGTAFSEKAINEKNPDLCLQEKENCYESNFEKSCISKLTNQRVCLQEYAIATSDSSVCEKAQGEVSPGGRSEKDACYDVYARVKKEELSPKSK